MKRIAIIIASQGFQDIEFEKSYSYFMKQNAIVDVYSTQKGNARGSFGKIVFVDKILTELDVDKYGAIVYIGGSGTPNLRKNDYSKHIAKLAFQKNKIIAAICWSPTILAKAGILKGKKATVWNGMDDEFGILTSEYIEQQGAIYTGADVQIDGNIITANGPAVAQKYAEEILKAL